MYICFFSQTGYLKSFTLEKSSPVTKYVLLFDLSTALISLPSEQGGHIPWDCQLNLAVNVDQVYPLNDVAEVTWDPLVVL